MLIKLKWDSEFFGFNIAHLDFPISFKKLKSINQFIKSNNIDFIQACFDISKKEIINHLENRGFNFFSTRINYINNLKTIKNNINKNIYKANENDCFELKKIVKGLFNNSRYYNCNKFNK